LTAAPRPTQNHRSSFCPWTWTHPGWKCCSKTPRPSCSSSRRGQERKPWHLPGILEDVARLPERTTRSRVARHCLGQVRRRKWLGSSRPDTVEPDVRKSQLLQLRLSIESKRLWQPHTIRCRRDVSQDPDVLWSRLGSNQSRGPVRSCMLRLVPSQTESCIREPPGLETRARCLPERERRSDPPASAPEPSRPANRERSRKDLRLGRGSSIRHQTGSRETGRRQGRWCARSGREFPKTVSTRLLRS
jgi:hypothetical protein